MIENVYPDEQEKLDNKFKIELELSMKIQDLLDLYNYSFEAKVVDGLPEVTLVPRVDALSRL